MAAPEESIQAALSRLPLHLSEVEADPSYPLDPALFEQVSPYLTTASVVDLTLSQSLIEQLARLLPNLQQDPTPAVNLLNKLIVPFDFEAIRSLQPPVDFAAGLDLAALPYHPLALSLIEKAAVNQRYAEFIASNPETIGRLVRLWLRAEDIGVAERAGNVLLALLKIDKDPVNMTGTPSLQAEQSTTSLKETGSFPNIPTETSYGTGFVWRRVFGDKDVYGQIFAICGAQSGRRGEQGLSRQLVTVAQARLLAWLPEVGALSWDAVTHSHHPKVEEEFDLKPKGGLMDWAALHVAKDDDVLMQLCLIEFYIDLLKKCTQPFELGHSTYSSKSLEYLKQKDLHSRTLSYFLNPSSHESFEVTYLYGPSANYLSTWSTIYPDDFEASDATKSAVFDRLNAVFANMKPAQWVHGESPKHDLHVLASLPRTTLLSAPTWSSSPLSLLPTTRVTNPDVLHTFATIFHGPADPEHEITFPAPNPAPTPSSQTPLSHHRLNAERAAAQSLFTLFLQHNPAIFDTVVSLAETLALKETALAALDFIAAIATADWSAPSSVPSPTATDAGSTPPTLGISALLTPSNPALPYLLKPAPQFSNLVGGRGDAENAAYQVASAKFDVLRVVCGRVEALRAGVGDGEGVKELEEVVRVLRLRIAEGVWGRGGDVGGRIATMEL